MKRSFPYVVLISSLTLAVSAAYYSVFGISKLFSAQAIAVAIMAGALEAAKLITATYLHRYWKYLNLLFKTYLTSAVVILMFITSKLLLLHRQKNLGELENEKLKSSYLNSKLENLKDQINPHFLFNSFANLSALINEDQHKAKKYLSNLSDVFRYTLNNSNEQIVDLIDELALLNSYIELYKIRVQDGLSLQIDLPNKQKKILNMSLQPLMENVIKHNEISKEKPLSICLKKKGDLLIFENNLNPKNMSVNSNGIGLSNLNERYKILVGKEINIQKSETHFIVTLPLI